jgi:hypothetical protein
MISFLVHEDHNASLNEVSNNKEYKIFFTSFQGGDDSHSGLISDPEDVSRIFLRNVGTHLPDHTVS